MSTAMAANTTAETPKTTTESTEVKFDRRDLTRFFARIRHEMGGLVDDANRKTPFYTKSKAEAIAKRDATIRVLDEFADRIDILKKEDPLAKNTWKARIAEHIAMRAFSHAWGAIGDDLTNLEAWNEHRCIPRRVVR